MSISSRSRFQGLVTSLSLLICFAGAAQAQPGTPQCGGYPCNQFQHTYWPMTSGNRWVFRNTNNSTIPGSPIVMSIQPSPSTFNCASSPVQVRIDKLGPTD